MRVCAAGMGSVRSWRTWRAAQAVYLRLDMLKTGRFRVRLGKIRFSHREGQRRVHSARTKEATASARSGREGENRARARTTTNMSMRRRSTTCASCSSAHGLKIYRIGGAASVAERYESQARALWAAAKTAVAQEQQLLPSDLTTLPLSQRTAHRSRARSKTARPARAGTSRPDKADSLSRTSRTEDRAPEARQVLLRPFRA